MNNNLFEMIKRIPLEGVLADFGIKVDHHKMVCPFHGDKHPSMYVYKDHAYCFVCNKTADAAAIVAVAHRLSQYDAAKLIAEKFGLKTEKISAKKQKEIAAELLKKEKQKELFKIVSGKIIGYSQILSQWDKEYGNCFDCLEAIMPGGRYYLVLRYQANFEVLYEEYLNLLDKTLEERYNWAEALRTNKNLAKICAEIRKANGGKEVE